MMIETLEQLIEEELEWKRLESVYEQLAEFRKMEEQLLDSDDKDYSKEDIYNAF